jgi:hypothetical protein
MAALTTLPSSIYNLHLGSADQNWVSIQKRIWRALSRLTVEDIPLHVVG